jgi:hypothetical protein
MFFNYGFALASIQTLNVEHVCMTPRAWKAKTKTPGSDKDLMIQYATKLFPHTPGIDKETADSVLLSEACRIHFSSRNNVSHET